MQYVLNFLRGAVIGVAEIIPGVSGGTMAVLMNIYGELIGAVSGLKRRFRQSALFLLPLVLGMGAAILALSHAIKFLLANYPMQVNFLFLGLVLGIVPMLLRRATATKTRLAHAAPMFVMLAIMLLLTWLSFSSGVISNEVLTEMDAGVFFRFLIVGFLAAVCLILPGISGSMIMVIFGVYDSVIVAISALHLIMLVPVAIGVLLGVAFGSKLIAECLRLFPKQTYFAICGLVLGSAAPLILRATSSGVTLVSALTSAAMLAVGVGVSLLFTSDAFAGRGRRGGF